MEEFNRNEHPHRRYNPLLKEWILVSPHRAKRPWDGQQEKPLNVPGLQNDPTCYLCAGNLRSNGTQNSNYDSTYVFDNDFPALSKIPFEAKKDSNDLFQIQPEQGINRVICFSPNHALTLPEMELDEIQKVIQTWKTEYQNLGQLDFIQYVQIFENKGSVMGCSNPHPHGQIWAQSSLPTQVEKTQNSLLAYYNTHSTGLLSDYLAQELEKKERIVYENDHFVCLVPFWAIWPFETLILSKRAIRDITHFSEDEEKSFADILKITTVKYDNLFSVSFPYSAGLHQAPTDGELHPEWHFHMHFYPPLLRSASVKKFMVGYEMLAEAQRDLTPEQAAQTLRNLSNVHYKLG
ncbi:MAG: UDP-glucose--hexose-1-phosphate uridylyltransferase [Crocinitomicaceae bacterium]